MERTTKIMHAQWDTSYIIGMWVTAVIAGLALIVTIIAGITWLRSDNKGYGFSGLIAVVAGIIFLIAGAIGTFISFPWSGQYHRFTPETGIVKTIGSRFLASDTQGGGSTQKFVVTFTDGRSYGCLDTRCANVGKGDRLTLLCERSFQFNAPDEGWDCNWGEDVQRDGQVIP